MLGSVRFLLAYLVVVSHLTGSEYFEHFGFYAVRGFFVLSGFSITRALHEVYRFDGLRFWANRALRVLPPYYAICLLTLAVVSLAPHSAAAFLKQWNHDIRTVDVLLNVLILPLQVPNSTQFRFLPPYWSIAVEIVMYVLLWLVISRREAFALIGMGAGIVYHLACLDVGWSWTARYFTAPSALLSFSVGAWIYFLHRRRVLTFGPSAAYIALLGWMVVLVSAGWIIPPDQVFGAAYYAGTICFAGVIIGLADYKPANRLARLDRILGDLAYPVFLLQWLVGFLVACAFLSGAARGWALTVVATPFLFIAAHTLALAQGALVDPIRSRLRHESRSAPPNWSVVDIRIRTSS